MRGNSFSGPIASSTTRNLGLGDVCKTSLKTQKTSQ